MLNSILCTCILPAVLACSHYEYTTITALYSQQKLILLLANPIRPDSEAKKASHSILFCYCNKIVKLQRPQHQQQQTFPLQSKF